MSDYLNKIMLFYNITKLHMVFKTTLNYIINLFLSELIQLNTNLMFVTIKSNIPFTHNVLEGKK